jgi:CoA:oxalate CoA-transferase
MIALATMFALFVRERTGIGQEVETSLLDVCMSMQTAQMGDYLIDSNLVVKGGRGWAGHFPYGPYTAKDGDIMIISGYTNEEWALVCKLLEMEHFAVDPRYDTPQKRLERREEVYSILDEGFSKKTRAEWQQIFHQYRLRADPCLTYEELFSHPQVEANKIVETVQHSVEGPTKVVGIPIKLSKTPGRVERAAPLLGEHTEEILRELGYSSQQIKVLAERGTVNIARASELKKREFRARWAKPPKNPSE